ncbi:hypothetical protein F53441_1072 [Fusarium austroafricanum]|uniref:Uncharacterized protein n=1 Tax=Fusarium austroafricanum TaxID=2364996 RepID=A0A8H4KUA8_9HYPO|nr:hypothetical protein F53441_1072 [Fusarium austroafricanum]
MSLRKSFKLWRILESQQQDIISSHADEDVLRYALQQFPRLKRVTVTPAAHVYLFEPLYETPMIRSLQYGFVYPILRGWPDPGDLGNAWADPEPWTGNNASEEEKNRWRGFRIVTRVLAQEKHGVSELIFDNGQLTTGLPLMAFDQETEEYKDFCQIIKRPGFHKLQLSLIFGQGFREDWNIFPNGHLRNALAGAHDIEYFSFHNDFFEAWMNYDDEAEDFVSLFEIFPINHWAKLTHFGLCRMQVKQDDLISLLANLPLTLRSVEPRFLYFIHEQGHYRGLLEDIRDKLDWGGRSVDTRIMIHVKMSFCL